MAFPPFDAGCHPAFPRAFGSASSANLSNRLSPTSAEQVCAQLQGKIPLIVDGGSCSVGIESTVVDLTGSIPTILRPGVIHRGVLSALVPSIQMASGVMDPDEGLAQRSPGQHRQHYAPEASLRVCRWEDDPSCWVGWSTRAWIQPRPVSFAMKGFLLLHRL